MIKLVLSIVMVFLLVGCWEEDEKDIWINEKQTPEPIYNDTEEEEEIAVQVDPIVTVSIENLRFKPNDLTIPEGTTVVWEHNDQYEGKTRIVHQVRVYEIGNSKNNFMGKKMVYGESDNYTFTSKGNFYYIDVIFKDMRGNIYVE